MNTSSKDTIEFCLQFIKDNVNEASQRTMCRTWLKTAMTTIENELDSSPDFIITQLNEIDKFLSGADASMTSVDVLTKIDTVKQLLQ